MFDDRTFDVIMNEMMGGFGADVRTDEGSLAYNACAKQAEKLEEIYGDMDDLNDNMLPDSQDIAHLIRYAAERGISYHYATAPLVRGIFRQEIEIGEAFVCGGHAYTVVEKLGDAENSYSLKCGTEGQEANATLGELEPEDYIDGYLGGEIVEILVAGTEDEDDEGFRKRVIESFGSVPFGGNKADYRKFVNDIPGVGGCKPKRRESGSPWVTVTVISSEFDVPQDPLIGLVQDAVDPEQSHGEGDGMAPICHNVLIQAAEATEINVSATVTFCDGYSRAQCQEAIEDAVGSYLYMLRSEWEDNGMRPTVIRISQLEARILNAEGVLDISGTAVNGSAENVEIPWEKIPMPGEVSINV